MSSTTHARESSFSAKNSRRRAAARRKKEWFERSVSSSIVAEHLRIETSPVGFASPSRDGFALVDLEDLSARGTENFSVLARGLPARRPPSDEHEADQGGISRTFAFDRGGYSGTSTRG